MNKKESEFQSASLRRFFPVRCLYYTAEEINKPPYYTVQYNCISLLYIGIQLYVDILQPAKLS